MKVGKGGDHSNHVQPECSHIQAYSWETEHFGLLYSISNRFFFVIENSLSKKMYSRQ